MTADAVVITSRSFGTEEAGARHDLPAATRCAIWVTNTPGANTDAVADVAVALTLDALRPVSISVAAAARGDWTPRRGRELGTALTPHIASQTREAIGRIGEMAVRKVLAVLRGEEPPNPVNRPGVLL